MNLPIELRSVLKRWLRQPMLGFLVTMSITLGIGITVLLFSVVHALLLEPFDYPEPERLVRIYASNPEQGYSRAGVALGDAEDLANDLAGVEDVSYVLPQTRALTGGGRPELIDTARVSSSFFRLLGFRTETGRLFGEPETRPGAPPVALLDHTFAERRFGSAEAATGQLLRLDGESLEILGVLAPGAAFGTRKVDVWTPFALPSGDLDRRSHYLPVLARLTPDATLEMAQREATRVTANLETEHPETNDGWTATVVDYRQSVVGSVEAVLWALFTAVLLVLLICCSNVASLLLARAVARSSEASLRSALGASRWNLISLFLLEGLTLTTIGGIFGVAAAWWGAKTLALGSHGLLPMATKIDINLEVAVFACALVVGTGLLVGLIPAWRFAHQAPSQALRVSPGRGLSRPMASFRGALTLVQTGLALVLIVAGGLALDDLRQLQSHELGFEPQKVAAVQILLHPERYNDTEDQLQFFETLLEGLGGNVDVFSAGAGSALPLHPKGRNSLSYRPLNEASHRDETQLASFTAVTPGFFRTLGITLLQGRPFNSQDRQESLPVAVVSRALAQRAWPQADPLGQKIEMNIRGSEMTQLEVVGVLGDILETDLRKPPQPSVFVPFRQFPHAGMVVVLRSSKPSAALERLKDQVYGLDPGQPIYESFLMQDMVEETGQRDRLFVTLFSVFGGFGLLLVMTGVYGVVLYSARQREQELGIRIALGASRPRLYYELLRGSLFPALLGLGVGLLVAVPASRYLETFLSEAEARDPTVFGLGLACLTVALLAAGISASMRVLTRDPARLLRDG